MAATSFSAGALAAETYGKVLGGNLLEEFGLVTRAENVDLLDGDGVEEALDEGEGGGEAPGGVYYVCRRCQPEASKLEPIVS